MSEQDSGEHVTPETTALTIFDEQANGRIRKVWFEGRWWFSVIDTVGLLTDSANPRKYWFDMKRNVRSEGFIELSERIRQLKMRSASDGKFYTTDAADRETLLRIIESIPSPKAEPFKQWLARVGAERMEEIEAAESSAAMERLRAQYRKKGYSDQWIERRIEKILVRNVVTAEWLGRGAKEGREFAQLTDTLSVGTFDITTTEHRALKNLRGAQNLQDSMTGLELALSSLAEETATALHRARDSQGFGALHRDTREAGEVGGAARRDIEARTRQPIVSPINYQHLRQERQRQLQPHLFDDEDEAK
ncbi:MAG TPA: Bro-N domain-containing protein [Ktedonobacterales bacterium]|nr:Bro-N domain-containing protein [Ktedonobacterales bacterium]